MLKKKTTKKMSKIVAKNDEITVYELQHSKENLTLQNASFQEVINNKINKVNNQGQYDLFYFMEKQE